MGYDLSHRTALVTGAGKGIGRAVATALGEAGATVVAVARTAADVEATAEAVDAAGGAGVAVTADVSDPEAVDDCYDEVLSRVGPPDVLINNAGLFLASPPLEQSLDDVDAMFDLNVRGLFYLTQRFGREFRDTGHEDGRIVNVASNVATVAVPSWTAYGATKAAVLGLTRGFALELADDGVTVNAVSPGTTRTPAVEDVLDSAGDDLYDFDRHPTRVAEPEDVAEVCLFLASDGAEHVTGEEVVVDGGVSITSGFYRQF
jgi:NAD(P)-dependent dehydrogenase (short-subunit alcohol dehydrogenase family)